MAYFCYLTLSFLRGGIFIHTFIQHLASNYILSSAGLVLYIKQTHTLCSWNLGPSQQIVIEIITQLLAVMIAMK